MKQNLSGAEKKIRFALGLIILAVGAYGVLVNLWLGLFVLGVGAFTVYEGYAGWTLVAKLTEAWIKEEPLFEEIVEPLADSTKELPSPD